MNTNGNGFDFNNAEKQTSFELIPINTVVPVLMIVKPGGNGHGGWLTQTKNNPDMMMLKCELTVIGGEYAKRKIWQSMIVEGHEVAANISRKTLRAIIEASKGINPDDMSQEAINGRKISGWEAFNGIAFPIKVGIEKAKPGSGYDDKNKILTVITPDMPEYKKITPPANSDGGYTPAAPVQTTNQYQAAPAQTQAPASAVPAWLKPKATATA